MKRVTFLAEILVEVPNDTPVKSLDLSVPFGSFSVWKGRGLGASPVLHTEVTGINIKRKKRNEARS